ncbi:MAG TPA: hypothetical protein VIL41_03875 [Coriobacteriia bacterium]
MSDLDAEPQGGVATALPPQPPSAPPRTAAAAPEPGRKRRGGCWLIVLVLVALAALGLGLWWLLAKPGRTASPAPASTAFDTAMKKAGVSTPGAPPAPLDLANLKTRGVHSFEATFTPEELGALANAFPHEVTVGNSKVSLRRVSLALVPGGGLALSGTASAGGTSYSGTVSGPVAFEDGHVVAAGPLSLDAQGLTIPAAQTQSAAQLLLAYVNGYLAAAPGLKIASASVGADGVHVTGTAPDTIAY